MRSLVFRLLTICADEACQSITNRSVGGKMAIDFGAVCAFPELAMPIFRIAAALSILALIQPEAVRAPLRFVASSLSGFAGTTEKSTDLITELCLKEPKRCADFATELLKSDREPLTGTVRRPARRQGS
jgi:hypothetical protein